MDRSPASVYLSELQRSSLIHPWHLVLGLQIRRPPRNYRSESVQHFHRQHASGSQRTSSSCIELPSGMVSWKAEADLHLPALSYPIQSFAQITAPSLRMQQSWDRSRVWPPTPYNIPVPLCSILRVLLCNDKRKYTTLHCSG